MHQKLNSLQVMWEQSSGALLLPQPSCLLARHSPEHTDELGGHELWTEFPDLSHIAQEAQHIAVQLLFLWELLRKQETGLYSSRDMVTTGMRNYGENTSRKDKDFWVAISVFLVDFQWYL